MQLEIKRYVHPCETTGRLVEEGRGRGEKEREREGGDGSEEEEKKLCTKGVKVGGGGGGRGKVTYGGEGEDEGARESGRVGTMTVAHNAGRCMGVKASKTRNARLERSLPACERKTPR